MMRFALVVVLVAFFSGSALGAFFKSGNALHADCQSKIDTLNRAVCYLKIPPLVLTSTI